jgi:peroxiredoxin
MHDQARQIARRAVLAALGVAFCLGPLCGCGKAPGASGDPPVAPAPSVRVVDAAQLVNLLNDARGTGPVVLNFWATWCPPCVQEMPAFSDSYRRWKKRGVSLISVSVDHPDTEDDRVKPFAREHALPFPVYVIQDRSPETVTKVLGLDWSGAVPATFVLDKQGHVAKAWFEEVTAADLAAAVDSVGS